MPNDDYESYLEIEADRKRWFAHWESMRPWFREQGYFLYEYVEVDGDKYAYSKPTMEYPETPRPTFRGIIQDPFPYAFMDCLTSHTTRTPLSTYEKFPNGFISYAQDAKGRHVAMKILKTEEEYQVLRLLKDQPRLQDPDSFPFVIPILDLLLFDHRWYAVMPRWGLNINQETFFPTFQTAIKYLISLLEGLTFLHELRIFHRDIATKNTLVNYIASVPSWMFSQMGYHKYLKSKGALRYAIMDFDLSMVLDEKTYGSNPCLPIKLIADIGDNPRPYEVMHAYIDFDPFKFDVACLGIHFSNHFHQIIPDVPLLAPLIDRMITSDINKRFSASEALAFARTLVLPSISSLDRIERTPKITERYYGIDRWEGLSESFVKEWGSYRENYSSWTMRFQNWLYTIGAEYEHRGPWYIMYHSRYIMRVLTWVPRFMLRLCRSNRLK